MPSTTTATQSIQVARALVTDGVDLTGHEEDTIEVVAGEPFAVRFSYTIRELLEDEENWTFNLETSIDGEEEAATTMTHKDRRIVKDAFISNLRQEYTLPPGEYEMAYKASATIKTREWQSRKPMALHDEATIEGTITVVAN